MKQHRRVLALAAVLTLSLANIAAVAQQTLDRTKIPTPGSTPVLRVPAWAKTQLSNGATLIVSERHGLPLISFTITFVGGSNQFEPAGRRGVGAMTASMLTEGTKTRTGDQLSDALQLLGTNIGAGVGGEEGSIGFVSTAKNFDATLAILADMMLNSVFPEEALERLRARTLVNLTQAKDQPTVVGAQVFAKILYGHAHPYGQRVTENSVKAITREDVMAFHKAFYQPGRALITVVGSAPSARSPLTSATLLRSACQTINVERRAGPCCAFRAPQRTKVSVRTSATLCSPPRPPPTNSMHNTRALCMRNCASRASNGELSGSQSRGPNP
jgi:hypothetical protein